MCTRVVRHISCMCVSFGSICFLVCVRVRVRASVCDFLRIILVSIYNMARASLSIIFQKTKHEQGRIGCTQYQPPEVISRGYFGKGCDIWGAGVLLHVLLSGRLPFLGSGKRLREVISGGRVVVAYFI